MQNSDIRFEMIRTSVLSQAKLEATEIRESADERRNNELSCYEGEVVDSLFDTIQRETGNLRQDTILRTSKIENKEWSGFFRKRKELAEALFERVAARLAEYLGTTAYRQQMMADIATLTDEYDHATSQFVLSTQLQDMSEDIITLLPGATVETTEDMAIGGWTFSNATARIFIDETMDTRLEKSKVWFYQNSNLTIPE